MAADALEMFGQVWAVRQAVTNPAYGGVGASAGMVSSDIP
jgi:acetyl-CoA carboxylase beta subunit